MKRIGILALVISVILNSCNGQKKTEKAELLNDTINPKTKIIVNKEYDDNGNLISYDSTYSSYYSNIKTDTLLGDSIFNNFKNYFNQNYGFSNQPYFNNFFFEDSLLKYDFYKRDFFSNRFDKNMEHMDHLFMEMDSLKNSFFNKQFQENEKGKSPKKE
jgi:hypothetical protein